MKTQVFENKNKINKNFVVGKKDGKKDLLRKKQNKLLFILTFATREHRRFEALLKLLNEHEFSYACI